MPAPSGSLDVLSVVGKPRRAGAGRPPKGKDMGVGPGDALGFGAGRADTVPGFATTFGLGVTFGLAVILGLATAFGFAVTFRLAAAFGLATGRTVRFTARFAAVALGAFVRLVARLAVFAGLRCDLDAVAFAARARLGFVRRRADAFGRALRD